METKTIQYKPNKPHKSHKPKQIAARVKLLGGEKVLQTDKNAIGMPELTHSLYL